VRVTANDVTNLSRPWDGVLQLILPDFVARGRGTGSAGMYRLWERGQGELYDADDSCCHIESQSVCDYFVE